ncbi:glycosyltransferase [Rhizobium puerariae]|uniref:Glycosyltransferase n=1 Tax=Rhizobium puerariae TaxID=1585791 RepID=A0ABV6AI52_9HYPH
MTSVVFLWDNIGPLHADRIEATRARLQDAARIVGVSVFAGSNEYDWVPATQGSVTLFADRREFGPVRFAGRLLGLVRRHRAGHVFLCNHDRSYVFLAALLLRATGRRVYLMVDSKFDDRERFLRRELAKWVFLLPYHGAMVAGPRSHDYMRFFGFPPERIRLGYDTVDVARLRGQAGKDPEPPFADRPFIIVARLVEKKNIALAIRAFAAAFAANRQRRLLICGSGPLLADLQRLCGQLGVAELVEFKGFVQTEVVSKLLAGSLALVLPSVEEQYGQVIAEAQALGTPAIVSLPCGARDELIRSGVNGFIVEPDNVEGLAYFMTLLGNDEVLWRRMKERTEGFAGLADADRFARSVAGFVTGEEAR